jgi:gamma-glutamyltranspeptidase/glutathione hydrolase
MSVASWRDRAGTVFTCEKTPVTARRGMVVTNHPLASAAAIEMLAAGGNAIDAAVAALFTLTVVEPMMVGILGGGVALIRLADGRTLTIDGLSTAPAVCRPDSYKPVSDTWPDYMETEGRRNAVGSAAVAVPGTLKAWCEALARFGKLSLDTVLEPAVRHAARGFAVTPYLATCIAEMAPDLSRDAPIAAKFLPGGVPLRAGDWLVQGEYADTLRMIAKEGSDAVYGGSLGNHIGHELSKAGGFLTAADLKAYATIERIPVRGTYRGVELIGPAPPASGGVQIVQMLNILEGFDIAQLGFGTVKTTHLILEALKIAGADRRAAIADPAFIQVPMERLTSKDYANSRRAEIDPTRAGAYKAGAGIQTTPVGSNESANTTHVTIADGDGNIITSTQTINSLFGSRIMIPGTGIIPNNYMYLFDPHPGHALSLAPGKRITSGISAMIGCRDDRPAFAIGLPGAHRIPSGALQAVINLVDHGMSLQEAVEAPRVFSWGQESEIETGMAKVVRDRLAAMGHPVYDSAHVGGGMCAIAFDAEGGMTGAACWRADGVPMGAGGGLARAGTSFWPDPRKRVT